MLPFAHLSPTFLFPKHCYATFSHHSRLNSSEIYPKLRLPQESCQAHSRPPLHSHASSKSHHRPSFFPTLTGPHPPHGSDSCRGHTELRLPQESPPLFDSRRSLAPATSRRSLHSPLPSETPAGEIPPPALTPVEVTLSSDSRRSHSLPLPGL